MAEYGYWLFNGKCGLVGKTSTWVTTAKGTQILVKDPNEPAVLEDIDIIFGLHTSQRARDDFERLFPTLDANSQYRLTELIRTNKQEVQLTQDDIQIGDRIQHASVTAGIRLRVKTRPAKINGGSR